MDDANPNRRMRESVTESIQASAALPFRLKAANRSFFTAALSVDCTETVQRSLASMMRRWLANTWRLESDEEPDEEANDVKDLDVEGEVEGEGRTTNTS